MDSMTFVIDIDGPQRLKSTDFDDDLTFTTTWLTFVEVLWNVHTTTELNFGTAMFAWGGIVNPLEMF